jgi:hypothetical protein
MSTKEQDQILGRLTREGKECQRNIATLEYKVSAFARSLLEVSQKLNGFGKPDPKPIGTVDDAVSAVGRIPDKQSIIDTLRELQNERDRAFQIGGWPRRAGPSAAGSIPGWPAVRGYPAAFESTAREEHWTADHCLRPTVLP